MDGGLIMTESQLQYNYCLQSVNKINELKAKPNLTEDELIDLEANIDHIQQKLAQNIFTDEDLTPLQLAIA